MNDNLPDVVPIKTLFVCVGIAALFGAAIKTYIDSCMYRIGVKHGYRVGPGDVDKELDEAREILHFHREDVDEWV